MSWNNDQVSREETDKIIELAQSSLQFRGDFVELGCYKGDTSLLLAEVLHGSDKKLWIYDSFEGLPEKSEKDYSAAGENFRQGELLVTKREVKERFLRAGFKLPIIKKAWFSELSPSDLPEEIAFSFLDGDFYESIKQSLELVWPKMVQGGLVLVHDYNNPALPGVSKAVDEWLSSREASQESIKREVFRSLVILRLG
ncbi:class I SAM-dependent methyltransferase [Candidatus Saccharibacteria bacterium]|nr:class I SAM-dependent methyltransferase [Candidatus Saccharibacteria bacterium]